jgi:hypothetical protein
VRTPASVNKIDSDREDLDFHLCTHMHTHTCIGLTRVSAGQEERNKPESSAAKALLLTSSGARERGKEWQNPVPFKENYPPPRTYYSLIGCSPSAQLSSRERQNTWQENCPCTCADYVYYLEHSCQRHLVMANVRAAPNRRQWVHLHKCMLGVGGASFLLSNWLCISGEWLHKSLQEQQINNV